MNQVAGPLVVLLNVVQASIFYAAPMLALVQFLKELRRPRKHHHHPPCPSSTALSPAPRYPYRTPEGATAVMYPPYPSSSDQQQQQPYPMESGGGAMALAAMESTDFRALAGLLGRTVAQWTALTVLLGLAGRLIQSLADSTSGGGRNPLITTLDVLVSGAAVFLSDQIGFLNFRVSRQAAEPRGGQAMVGG